MNWTSVKDKLPWHPTASSACYLVWINKNSEEDSEWPDFSYFNIPKREWEKENVTHWALLPDAPEN